MDDSLAIHTLGFLTIKENGRPVTGFASRKVEALLVYLACTRREHPREALAELLWDERSQTQSLANLRVVLNSLRQQLASYLSITRQAVALNPESSCWVDAIELQASLDEASAQRKRPGGLSPDQLDKLERSLDLYKADFLTGFTIYECRGFEEWMMVERERLRRQVIEALDYMVDQRLKRDMYAAGIPQAARLLALEPLHEPAHRQMMILLARTGQRREALAQYEACRQILSAELNVEPAPETTALYERIRIGELAPFSVPVPDNREPGSSVFSYTMRGYELGDQIGEGAHAKVYQAFQPLIGRDVAIKIIQPEYANEPDFIRRFEREAQIIARLEHLHIVPLYDYWRDSTGAYLVMRWLRGGSLRTRLRSGPLRLDIVTRLLDQIAAALTVAHRHGVVHRDIKPDNVLLDEEGNAYLADFGIAKDDQNIQNAPDDLGLAGTLAYSAPEQITGGLVDPRTDLYCLGIMLYEMLVGTRPFRDDAISDTITKQLSQPLPPLNRRELPSALDAVLQRATAKSAAARYPDALSLVQDFQRAAALTSTHGTTSMLPRAQPGSPDGPTLVELETGKLENPYKGLRAFQEADASDFFGRDAFTDQIIKRLAESGNEARFLAIVGPAASGKSSVVRAGVIPALRRSAIPGSKRWFVVEMVPGPYPFEELEAALLSIATNPPVSLLELLQGDERGLARALKRILPSDTNVELLLLIDQFEEVFGLVEEEAARSRFLDGLAVALDEPHSRLRTVITLRSDFYDPLLGYPSFEYLLSQRTETIPPLSRNEMVQAMTGPAERFGITLVPELVNAILADVGDTPENLSLFQYLLTDLFEHFLQRKLTLATYRANGGIQGAVARRASELNLAVDPAWGESPTEIFERLKTPDAGLGDSRRRVWNRQTGVIGSTDSAPAVAPKTCTHCGATNRPAAKACSKCGHPFRDTVSTSQTVRKACPNCGRDNRPSAKVCIQCGYRFQPLQDRADLQRRKICPRCGTLCRLEAKVCIHCRHQFRTDFGGVEALASDGPRKAISTLPSTGLVTSPVLSVVPSTPDERSSGVPAPDIGQQDFASMQIQSAHGLGQFWRRFVHYLRGLFR